MSEETFLRARLQLELRAAQDELERLGAERLRLLRRNEMFCSVLYELRGERALSEAALSRIEDALAFDGQPWADERAPDDDEELDDLEVVIDAAPSGTSETEP